MQISEYKQRRIKLMEKLGKGIFIVASNPESKYSNDVHYKYRQHTNLIYYSGFLEPNTTLIIENGEKGIISHLFVPKRDPEFEIWNGRRFGVKGAISIFGVDKAYVNTDLAEFLKENLINYETVFYSFMENKNIDELILNSVHEAIHTRIKPTQGPINLINPIYTIQEQRIIKSEYEIKLITEAARISVNAHTRAMKITNKNLNEYHIESIIDYEFRKSGASGFAYPSIVGGGVNATILHYIENSADLKDGDLLLVDAAAEYNGYAADITRTWPISGKFSDAQKIIYQIVLDVQKTCIEMIKPGAIFDEITDYAIKTITQELLKLKLLSGELDKNIEDKNYRRFYMHGLGHWLGIDTHDTSLIKKDQGMKIGSYITVEPGIYIPDEEDIEEKFRGIGVRIEDDILVTENGNINLSKGAVKEIEDIEAIVGSEILP